MTKLKIFHSCLAILLATGVALTTNTMLKFDKELRSEILGLVNDLNFDDFDLKKDESIVVTFLVNKNNQVVILYTNNPDLDEFFKESLNYKTIRYQIPNPNQIYTVPISLKL